MKTKSSTTSTNSNNATKIWETKARGTSYEDVYRAASELGLLPEKKGLTWKIRKYRHNEPEEYFKLKVLKTN